MSNVEKIKLIDLELADYNPRQISDNNIDKLRNSIHSFGFVDPIIINLKNNRIIGGHQRYKVLMEDYDNNKELNIYKLGDIGWVFPDEDIIIKSEEDEKALNISLNQNNLMGEWDNEKLKDIFKDLNDVDFDLELTGFDDFEIDFFLDDDYETFNYQHLLDEDDEKPDEPENKTEEETSEDTISSFEQKNSSIIKEPSSEVQSKIEKLRKEQGQQEINTDETLKKLLKKEEKEIDYADVVPDDYVDVKGDNANKSYVISIGFDTHETANQFLQYINYHRLMKRDTLQFMWTELNIDIGELLEEKIKNQKEQEELEDTESYGIWDYYGI